MIHSSIVTLPENKAFFFFNQRIFEDHMMGNLQGLPVLIGDKAGLDQEAVDQSECDRKRDDSGSQRV